MLGEKEKLKTVYAKLIELCSQADVQRPELMEAKEAISRNKK
jgi:hypothetical protein